MATGDACIPKLRFTAATQVRLSHPATGWSGANMTLDLEWNTSFAVPSATGSSPVAREGRWAGAPIGLPHFRLEVMSRELSW